ncbi:MAG: FAD-binding oxidoreductase [Bacillota bacterium]
MLSPEIQSELRAIVGTEWCLTSKAELVSYSYSATPRRQRLPDAVVLPRTSAEVAAIMRLAHTHRIPVHTRGSGTNLSAGSVPVAGGIVLSLNRMNSIKEIDQENLTVTVEPGVITAKIHQAVEALGLFYPPDPGSMNTSTIGGNVSECAGGLRGLKYGVTKDYVMGLEAVTADGRLFRAGGKNMKDVAGYDLVKLLVGSEGTLAVITEITLKLLPLPEAKRTALAAFHNLEAAARTVSRIIASRIIPCTLEFMDNGTIRAVEDFAKIGLPVDADALLLIQQDGPSVVCERDIERIATLCREEGAFAVKLATDPSEEAALLSARRAAIPALARRKPTTILEDATVPRSQIAPMVTEINRIAAKYKIDICTFGHAGDGNLHPTCMTDERDEEEVHRVEEAFAEIFTVALSMGGTITGEHGIGETKAPYLEWKVGPVGVDLMKAIKQAFDPENILNPGKIFAKESRKRVVVQS